MIKYAIFDVDGTLLDTSLMWNELPSRYLETQGIHTNPAEISKELYGLSLGDGVKYIREKYNLPYSTEELIKQTNAITRDFYTKKAALCKGAKELVTSLYEKGIPLAIATAGDRTLINEALNRHGIFKYFTGMANCAEHGSKTSPAVYLAAAQMMGAKPSQTIVFEDSLFGVKSAIQAGFITAAVYDISEENQQELQAISHIYARSLTCYLPVDKLLNF